jgi:type I restriction enzyme S subunit
MSGQLVEQWPLKTLGELCQIRRGQSPRPIKSHITDDEDGVNWIKISDAGDDGKYIFNSKQKIHRKSAKKLVVVNDGDFILTNSMSFGRPYIVRTTGCVHDGWLIFSEYRNHLNQDYLYYALNSPTVSNQFEQMARGSTVRNLNIELVKKTVLPVPPLEEQQRIVSILDEALENISNSTEQINQKIHNVNALFPSILKSLIPQDVNDCEEVLLGNKEYIQIIDGDRGVNYPKKSDFMNEGHCLFLNTKNVLRNGFNFDTTMFIDEEKDELLRKGKLQRNDVILTTRGTLGNTAVYHDEIPFNHIRINSGMLIFRPNIEKIYPKYLYHLFTSDITRSQISSHSRGAAQPHLPVKVLSKFLIPIPKSIDLQKVIVERLELLATEYDLLLQKLRQEMKSFDELRQSILQEAFNGTLRIS